MTAPRDRRGLFAAFASLGVTAAFIPAMLPGTEVAADAELSGAVPVLFAGVVIGVLAVGPLRRTLSLLLTLKIGCALQAAALILAASNPHPVLFVSAAASAGIGFGLVEAAGSIAAKQLAQGSSTGLLSALTGTVAVCAAITPLAVAAAAASRPLLCLLAVVPCGAIILIRGIEEPIDDMADTAHVFRRVWPILGLVLALPLYVGVETVLSGWSATITHRVLDVEPAVAAVGTTVFWTLMALGRFFAAIMRHRGVSPIVILGTGAIIAATSLCCAGLLVVGAPIAALVATAVAVGALAPSYGIILGLALDSLDPASGRRITGALVACGSIGGVLVPAAVLTLGRDPASIFTFAASAALCVAIPFLAAWGTRTATAVRGRSSMAG